MWDKKSSSSSIPPPPNRGLLWAAACSPFGDVPEGGAIRCLAALIRLFPAGSAACSGGRSQSAYYGAMAAGRPGVRSKNTPPPLCFATTNPVPQCQAGGVPSRVPRGAPRPRPRDLGCGGPPRQGLVHPVRLPSRRTDGSSVVRGRAHRRHQLLEPPA